MEPTYSDRYANLMEDPAMEAYFVQLPGYIQAKIRSRKQQPASCFNTKNRVYQRSYADLEELQHSASKYRPVVGGTLLFRPSAGRPAVAGPRPERKERSG